MTAGHALPPHWLQILLALAEGDRHGLGIMSEVLEQTGGGMRLWPAMLYRNLQRLADEGLIVEVAAPAPQPGSPRYFRITASGRRACAAEARRLDGIVGDLLDLERLAAGALEPMFAPVDVGALVRELVAGACGFKDSSADRRSV